MTVPSNSHGLPHRWGDGSLDRPILIMARPEPSLFVEDLDVAEVVLKETAREPSVEKVVVSVISLFFHMRALKANT